MDDGRDAAAALLEDVRRGVPGASDALFSLLYAELRRIAGAIFGRGRGDHTLQPTALVHEAYMKMVRPGRLHSYEDRSHFLNVAARAMRQVLVNHAREAVAQKRGGGRRRDRLSVAGLATPAAGVDVLDLDDALEALAAVDERQGRIAELRLFGGFTNQEVAALLGVSLRTVELDWRMAKGTLAARLRDAGDGHRG